MSSGQDTDMRRKDRRVTERRRSHGRTPTGPWSDLHRPLRTLLFLLIAAVLIQIYHESEFIAGKVFDVLLLFVFAAIIALLLTPLVDRVERVKMLGGRRSLAVLTLNLALLVLVAAFLALLIPSVLSQATALGQQAPKMMAQLQDAANGVESWLNNRGIPVHLGVPADLNSLVAPVLGSALQIASGVLGGLINLLLIAVIALYLQLQGPAMIAARRQLYPRHQQFFDFTLVAAGSTLARYVRGQVIFAAVVAPHTRIPPPPLRSPPPPPVTLTPPLAGP